MSTTSLRIPTPEPLRRDTRKESLPDRKGHKQRRRPALGLFHQPADLRPIYEALTWMSPCPMKRINNRPRRIFPITRLTNLHKQRRPNSPAQHNHQHSHIMQLHHQQNPDRVPHTLQYQSTVYVSASVSDACYRTPAAASFHRRANTASLLRAQCHRQQVFHPGGTFRYTGLFARASVASRPCQLL